MPLKWKRQWVADEGYEAAGVMDVDNDGVLDIVSGAFWYRGPDFRSKHAIGPVAKHGEYYDDFSVIAMDVNRDGYSDFITAGWWGNTLRWRENPKGDPQKEWPGHVIAEVGNVETTRAWDIDGDGELEIVPNTPNRRDVLVFKLVAPGQFACHRIFEFPEGETQGHGLGCGDIAGQGRKDLILKDGWLEAPENPWSGRWKWHPDLPEPVWGRTASIPMLVERVNGIPGSIVIVGQAHGYGLWWLHRNQGRWGVHPIDPFHSQYHDLQWLDIDGDGECELVTGKRHRAHCGRDPGEWDDIGFYYFKWTGEGFAKHVIDYGPAGVGKGCGIHFAAADLRGTGRLDLVAPGKEGLCVFFNEGRE